MLKKLIKLNFRLLLAGFTALFIFVPDAEAGIGDYYFPPPAVYDIHWEKLAKTDVKYYGDYIYTEKGDGTAVINRYQGTSGGSVTIPAYIGGNKVTEIGEFAFYEADCTEVIMPDTLKIIGYAAFEYCSFTSVKIPDSVELVDDWAFTESKLQHVTIGNGVKELDHLTFMNCPLQTVTIGKSLNIPASDASSAVLYENNIVLGTSLTDIFVHPDNPFLSDENGVLYNKDKTVLIQYPANRQGESFTVNKAAEVIAGGAFYEAGNLLSLALPENLTEIGVIAFADSSLTDINIPDGIKEIRNAVFHGSAIKDIFLPDTVETIGYLAFGSCTAIERIKLPAYADLGNDVFVGCTSLKTLSLPENYSLESGDLVAGCSALTQINFSALADNVTEGAFIYNRDKSKLVVCLPALLKKGHVTVPEGVREIAGCAFHYCENLTGITLPDSLEDIGALAFYCCTALRDVRLPEGLESIGDSAFSECTAIESINLPSGLRSIGESAFMNNKSLKTLRFPEGITLIETTVCYFCDNLESVYIPASVTEIGGSPFLGCPKLTIYGEDKSYAQWWVGLEAWEPIPFVVGLPPELRD